MRNLFWVLAVVGVLGAGCGRRSPHNHVQRETIAWIESIGGSVTHRGVSKDGRALIYIVDLSHTSVTDAGLSRLGCFGRLERLALDHTAVKGTGLDRVRIPIDNYSLSDTQVGDSAVVHCLSLVTLDSFDVSNTEVTERSVARLVNAESGVKEVDFSCTKVAPDQIELFTKLEGLETVRLNGLPISGKQAGLVVKIGKLPSMKHIEIRDTMLSQEDIDFIRSELSGYRTQIDFH